MSELLTEQDFVPYQAMSHMPAGRALVLAPHPDDEVFGCGGAIMSHREQGDEVTVFVATDGRAAEPHVDDAACQAYIVMRQAESRAAAAVLGYQEILFDDVADRELRCDETLIRRLMDLIEQQQATRVYAPSVWEMHPDHRALADAAVAAVSRCGAAVTLIMYEIGVPLHPNLLLALDARLEQKRAAMACFHSQLRLQDYRRHLEALHAYRSYTLPPTVTMAEGFYQVNGAELAAHPEWRYGRTRQTLDMINYAVNKQ